MWAHAIQSPGVSGKASAATSSVSGGRLAVAADGKFFVPAGVGRRGLVFVEVGAGGVGAVAEVGGDGVVAGWPLPGGLAGAAAEAGLLVAADVGGALASAAGGGFLAGRRAGRRLAVVAADVGLLIVEGGGLDRRLVAGAVRGLRSGGGLVAGPLEDRRAGRAGGQAVAACLGGSVDGFTAEVAGLQLDVRRRPLVVELEPGEGLFERLAAAADLGVAAVLVRGGTEAERLGAVGRLVKFERDRLDSAPLVSVVVCAYNAERYLEACLRSLRGLLYPRYEVIVVDDGSTDATRELARAHEREGVRLVELDHVGLSAARNAGARTAQGDWVAYIDADAEAHPDWLAWAWRGLDRLAAEGISGPNYPFAEAGFQERVVSGAPGAPVPAVNPDGSAEHLPGCNMIFRRELVLETRFQEHRHTSSDDVAFCHDALDRGAKLVYHPTAAVDHHRRPSMAGYLRQQHAYGKAVASDDYVTEVGYDRAVGESAPPTPWRSRLNPFKRRYIFSGAQEEGLYAQRQYGARIAFPWRVAGAASTLLAAALIPAVLLGQGRRWLLATGATFACIFTWVAASVPAFRPRSTPRGLAQRMATAFLWLAQPVVRAGGIRSARRRQPE
jgi:glycosyltransferase involved in cell wall biosynthesis